MSQEKLFIAGAIVVAGWLIARAVEPPRYSYVAGAGAAGRLVLQVDSEAGFVRACKLAATGDGWKC